MTDLPIPAAASAIPPATFDRPPQPRAEVMRHQARAFETMFLTEMLKHAGVGKMPDGFNGGPGEAAFTDMLTREYAKEISRAGGLGLADQVMEAMQRIQG